MKLRYIFNVRPIFFFATGAGALGGDGGGAGGGAGTSGSPAGGGGSSPTLPSGSSGGDGGGAGAGAGGGTPDPAAGGPAQLRSAYDKLKKDYEPWSKLGVKPEDVTAFQGTYQAIFTEVAGIGRELGYEDDEIVEALHAVGPIKTLDFLREEAAKAGEGGGGEGEGDDDAADLDARIRAQVERGLQPLHHQENVRRTNAANDLFVRTTHNLIGQHFKGLGLDIANVPKDAVDLIQNATSEILKYDLPGLKELKMGGKTAAVQKAFNQAMDMLDRYFVARSGWENKGRPAPGGKSSGAGGEGGAKKPSLEDMINDPGLINKKYA